MYFPGDGRRLGTGDDDEFVLCGGHHQDPDYYHDRRGCGVRLECDKAYHCRSGDTRGDPENGDPALCCLCMAKESTFDSGLPEVEELCGGCRERYKHPP